MAFSRGAWEALRRADGAKTSEIEWLRYALEEEHKKAQKLASNNTRLRTTIKKHEALIRALGVKEVSDG